MNPYMFQHLPSKLRIPHKWRPMLIKHFPTLFSPPWMTPKEYKLLKKYSETGNKVVEFGSGGSTFHFLKCGKSVFSIESDSSYIEYLLTFPIIKRKISQNTFQIYHANIGETHDWGMPKDKSMLSNWPSYYQAVWDKFNINEPDIVLIDGRFRVMCALSAIPYISPQTIVMVHDFPEREYYKVILNYYEIIEQEDSLVVLRLKEYVDMNELLEYKSKYRLDCR